MKKCYRMAACTAALALAAACEYVDHSGEMVPEEAVPASLSLERVARMLSAIPVETAHVREVHDAVSSSSVNGYDEEYTMADLFRQPGAGVGDMRTKGAEVREYSHPLRDLIREYVTASPATRAGSGTASPMSPEAYLEALQSSDIQIYWPYSDAWDGTAFPVITFDPADGSEVNTGYVLTVGPDGRRQVEEVLVDEKMAQERPVWVVNRNDDSEFASLEMLRREDPDWGTAGGDLIVGTKAAGEESIRTLILKSFTANRNFDPWFAGASEFFVKCGSVENFKAKTEADLLLYTPSVTDFMIVVKRSQVGSPVPFNAVLISQWTDQLSTCAFMIHEDDGGTWTAWNCKIEGKMQSKTTGIDISIPFRSRDDIVWRGQLTSKYFEHYDDVKGHFGDVDITFALQKR